MISCSDIVGSFLEPHNFYLRQRKDWFQDLFLYKTLWLLKLEFEKRILDGRFKMTQTLNADSFNQKIMGAAQAW